MLLFKFRIRVQYHKRILAELFRHFPSFYYPANFLFSSFSHGFIFEVLGLCWPFWDLAKRICREKSAACGHQTQGTKRAVRGCRAKSRIESEFSDCISTAVLEPNRAIYSTNPLASLAMSPACVYQIVLLDSSCMNTTRNSSASSSILVLLQVCVYNDIFTASVESNALYVPALEAVESSPTTRTRLQHWTSSPKQDNVVRGVRGSHGLYRGHSRQTLTKEIKL